MILLIYHQTNLPHRWQVIHKLKNAEQLIAQGKTDADVCCAIEVTQQTYHRWKQHYCGMQAGEAKRLTQLEKAMLKELAKKILSPKRHRRAIKALRPLFQVSERFACKVVG
jgi:putative transposase